MQPSQVREAMKLSIKSGVTLMIWGPPGGGKTTLAEQFSSELCGKGDHFKWLPANLMTLDDLVGIPYPRKNGKKEISEAIWLRPEENIPSNGSGIILLDEITDGDISIQKKFYSLIYNRRIKNHVLPENWHVMCAANRLEDGGSRMVPQAFITRVCHVGLYCNPPSFDKYLKVRSSSDISSKDWCEWANNNGINPLITAFVRFKTEHFFSAQANPRTWEFVNKLLIAADDWGSTILGEMIGGTVGPIAGTEFYSFMRLATQIPSFDEIKLNPDTAPVPTEIGVLYALSSSMAHHTDKKSLPNIIRYVRRMPKEFQVFAMDLVKKKDPEFLTVPEMIAWLNDNADLVTV